MPTLVLVLKRNSTDLSLVGVRRGRPEWLGAIPLGALALLPIIGPGPLSVGRVAMALLLGGLTTLLIVRALPRRWITPLRREGSAVMLGDERHEGRALRLSGVRDDSQNSALCFRAELVTPRGGVVLLEGLDPGAVLSQADELSSLLDLPLEPDWGLHEGALSTPGPAPAHLGPELRVVGPMRPSQQATGYTALGSTAFVTCFIGVLLVRRLELGLEISALSLLLACLIVAFGVVVSVGVLGVRSELSLSSQGLVYHRLLLGRRWRRKAVPASELLRLLAVSPDGGEPTHLLVRHGQTWLGFPLPGDKAREIAERFGSISPSSGQPPESAEAVKSTEFSQVRTASG